MTVDLPDPDSPTNDAFTGIGNKAEVFHGPAFAVAETDVLELDATLDLLEPGLAVARLEILLR